MMNMKKFNLKFAKVYDNSIFTDNGMKPVVEDYLRVEGNMFCVADGVTRDSIYGEAVPYPKNKEEVEQWIKVYPNPSGAYNSAEICADKFIEYLSNYDENEINEQIISEIVRRVNKDIWTINEGRNIDYLKEDLYCCVAVGGIIINNILYCFSIGDSHILALDENANILFETNNNHKQFEDYLENVYCKENKFDWDNPECRKMVRRDYRNKPDKQYKGKDVSFGVFSGEKEAEYYIEIYKVELENAKYVCAYSDGCESYFDTQEKRLKIVKYPKIIQKEGKERTLIIYEKE